MNLWVFAKALFLSHHKTKILVTIEVFWKISIWVGGCKLLLMAKIKKCVDSGKFSVACSFIFI
jgi:hypothetical protein